MARRSGPKGPPKSFVTSAGRWPTGPFKKVAPAAVPYVAQVSARLRQVLDERALPVAEVAAAIGVSKTTIYDVLNGETFIETMTLAALEQHLNVALWPTE